MNVRSLSWLCAVLFASAGSASAFDLSSVDLKPNARIDDKFVFNGFGCAGQNVSPALAWKNAPEGTKSFALLVHDPDAPTGGAGWWHWVVVNLPATTTALAQGAGAADGKGLPAGAMQITTDFGASGWGGPCPPVGHGTHHYHFTLHALKVERLDLAPNATASLAGFMVNANSLGKAELTATYER